MYLIIYILLTFQNQQTAFRQVIDDTPIMLDQKTDFSIKFPNATILLR